MKLSAATFAGRGSWKVITPQWTYQMYQRYPDDVKTWVDAHHAQPAPLKRGVNFATERSVFFGKRYAKA